MSPNDSMLVNGVQIPKLLNDSFYSCSLINFDFLPLHTAYFYKIIFLLLLAFETLGFVSSVSSLHFKQYHDIVI